jgi:hypothetical protein
MGPAAAPPDDYEAAKDSEAELVRVMQTLKELRSKFYSQLDMVRHTRFSFATCSALAGKLRLGQAGAGALA